MKKYFELLNTNKWLVLILVLATILRFFHLDYQSLWMDEIYTLNITNPKLSLKQLHDEVLLRDGFPYLYYILLRIEYFFFGYSSFVARSFSAVMGIASVYLIYRLGKQLIHHNAGLLAALLLTLNEYNIYISQDARPYSFYLFTILLSYFGLVKLLEDRTIKNAIFYGAATGLLLNTNFFGFINVFSQVLLIVFFFIVADKAIRKQIFLRSLLSGGIAILLFLPNIDKFLSLFAVNSFWIPAPKPDSFSLMFKEFLGDSEITLFIFFPLFLFYVIKMFSVKENTLCYVELLTNRKIFSLTVLFSWIFIFFTFLMVKSYGEVSFVLTRYFTSILPVFFLVLGTALYFIKNKMVRGIVVFALSIMILVNIFYVKNYYYGINKAQFREASNFVIENNTNKQPVLTSQKYWFDYYFVNEKVNIGLQETELEALVQQMMQDPSKIKSFWFVDAFGKTYALSEAAQNFVNNTFYIENNYDGFQAWAKHFVILKDMPTTVDISKFGTLSQQNGDALMYNLETFENDGTTIKASGWAYFDKQEAVKSSGALIMIKDGKATRMVMQKVNRPDVTAYFKNEFNVDNSGFSATYDLSKLESGKYQIGIYLVNKETKKEGLVLTDKIIEKQ